MPNMKHKYGNASQVTTHVDSYADGGKVHGSPMSTPKPGGTTRKRPKVGDRDPNWKKPDKARTKPKRIEGRGEPGGPNTPGAKAKRNAPSGSAFRDYRGNKGAIEDAGG